MKYPVNQNADGKIVLDNNACFQCSEWEAEISAIYKSLAVELNEKTVDGACSEALEKIAQLKHLAIEIAAHSECQCEDAKGDCLFCIARRLVDSGVKWTDGDEFHFRDAMLQAGFERDDQGCVASQDGDCSWAGCPQLRDEEPKKSGRHCPIDKGIDRDTDD